MRTAIERPEEFEFAFQQWNWRIRQWRGGLSISASAKSANKHGTLMAHCYIDYPGGQVVSDILDTNYPVDYSEFFPLSARVRDELLDEGFAVSPQDGVELTHLFHRGRREGEVQWVSFGMRASDDEVVLTRMRDFAGGLRVMRIDGPYDGDIHPPFDTNANIASFQSTPVE